MSKKPMNYGHIQGSEKPVTHVSAKTDFCNANCQGKVTELIFLNHYFKNDIAHDAGEIGKDEYKKNLERMYKTNCSKLEDEDEKKRVVKLAEEVDYKLKRMRLMDQVEEMKKDPGVLNRIDFLGPLMTTTMELAKNRFVEPKEAMSIFKDIGAHKDEITDEYSRKLFNSHYEPCKTKLVQLHYDN